MRIGEVRHCLFWSGCLSVYRLIRGVVEQLVRRGFPGVR